jgi:membrane protease YdiL (CAAX protease family)
MSTLSSKENETPLSTHGEKPRGSSLRAHPLASMVALEVLFLAVFIGGSRALKTLLPGMPAFSTTGVSHALLLACVNAALVLGIIARFGWWRASGFTPRAEWRDLRLYVLPGILVFAPFVAGVKPLPVETFVLLLVGYLISCVFEEGFFRGIAPVILRPLGLWPVVLISSLLFGLSHLGNQAVRGVSSLIVLQAIGAGVQGIGYAALRLRTNVIWLLILIHALHDLTLQMGHLPIAMVEAPIDIIIAVYGIVLLRRRGCELLPSPLRAQGQPVPA